MSYTKLLYHIVFRTKNSRLTICEAYEENLYRYIWGFVKNHKSVLHRINGMPDHLHLFVGLHPTIAISDFVKELKVSTHRWLDEHKEWFPDFEAWARGYCALSYSEKDKEMIINYIKNQKEHHAHETYIDEVRRLLEEVGVEIDERYFEEDV